MTFPIAAFKRPTLLIVGCGDVGLRVVKLLRGRWRLLALTSSRARLDELRAAGALPLLGNLDEPATLAAKVDCVPEIDSSITMCPPYSTRLKTSRPD